MIFPTMVEVSPALPHRRFVVLTKHENTSRHSYVVGKTRNVPPPLANPAILEAADGMVTRVATAFLRTVQVAQNAIPLKELEVAIENKDVNAALQALNLEARLAQAAKGVGIGPQQTSFQEALKDTFQAGAQAELQQLQRTKVSKADLTDIGLAVADSIGVKLAFDLLNEEAVAFLSAYTFDLIRQISSDAQRAIQATLVEAFREGGHPYEQARNIRQAVGLTDTQIRAVTNFQRALSGGPESLREALRRGLRDKRFDGTLLSSIEQGGILSANQIQKMTDRYYERYLKYRSEMIARTETIRAATMGQQEVWRQAVSQGLLDPSAARQKWLVTRDDRLCSICQSVPRMNPKGVPLGEVFQSTLGPVSGPPLHPHCRCALSLVTLLD